MRLYDQPAAPLDQVPQRQADKYEHDAGRFWDLFYARNADRFFKDRHYFDKEWPQLTRGSITVLEVGCGAGNSVFPLLEINPASYVYACDFSPRAVALVQQHPEYAASGRVTAFVADITQHEGRGALSRQLPGRCVDVCSMVFVLSAVAPQHMRQTLRNVAAVLKRGTARVLFRDYALGDMAQARLESSSGVRLIRGNFYVRGDGTCCYYFGEAELVALFAAEGFVCEASTVHARVIENRKSGVKMPRRWIQAEFRYDPDAAQQQQQQQEGQQEGQQQGGAASLSAMGGQGVAAGSPGGGATASAGTLSSSVRADDALASCSCAGGEWVVPAALCSSVSSIAGPAEQLAVQVQQCRLDIRGRCMVVLPPWLQLQLPAGGDSIGSSISNGGITHQQPQQPPPGVCSSSSMPGSEAAAPQEQGAAAALVALVATLLGARRVYLCLPAAGDAAGYQQQAPQSSLAFDLGLAPPQLPSAQEAAAAAAAQDYEAALQAVMRLNECRVVAERVRHRRWQRDNARHAAGLERELVQGVFSARMAVPCSGLLLVAARQASAESLHAAVGSTADARDGCEAAAAIAVVWAAAGAATQQQPQMLLLL